MKTGARIIIATALILGAPMVAFAAQVHVLPTTTNSHGGKKNPIEFSNTISYQGGQFTDIMTGIGTYDLSQATADPVDYTVTPTPMDGYTFTLSGACSGAVDASSTKECEIDWLDNAPALQPAPSAPAPAPMAPTPTVTPPATPDATPAAVAPVVAPQPAPEVVTKTIIIHEYTPVPATTTIESPTTTADIADLKTRVGLLEQIVQALQSALTKILNFLGL